MADIEFKDWGEFGLQFGDIIGQQRLEVVQRVLKHAEKIVYCDDAGIVGVYISASCKNGALKGIGQLTDAGWSVSTNPLPKNGLVFALSIMSLPISDDEEVADVNAPIDTTEEDTMTNPTNTQTTNTTVPQYVTMEQLTVALNSAFASNVAKITADAAEAATKAAVAAAATAAETAATAAVTKLKADMVAQATTLTTQAASAAEAAAKAELEKFGTQLKAAEAANKALSAKVEGLQDEAKKLSKKAKKAKSESGFLDDYSTSEKVVAAAAVGLVGYVIWDKFIKD